MGQILRSRLGSVCCALAGIVSGAATAHGAAVTDPATGHSYEVIQEGKTWAEAKSAAEAMSTAPRVCHLAVITSQAENDFVVANLIDPLPPPPDPNNTEDVPDVWIGGERLTDCTDPDSPSNWGIWVTGEPWLYTNWSAEEFPDDDGVGCDEGCVVYGRDEGLPMWETEFCAEGQSGGNEEIWYLVECSPRKVVDPATKHSYQLIIQQKTWEEARVSAAAMSSATEVCHLATITSQAEENFIHSTLLPAVPPDEDVWLGGKQRDPCIGGTVNDPSLWGTWVTGESWVYTNWATSEPDGEDSDGGCPLLGCLTYGNEETPPVFEDAGCEDDEVTSCLVECQPVRTVPAISPGAIVVFCLLALVLAWRSLRRSEARSR